MFAQVAPPTRKRTTRNQLLSALLFGAGAVLNVISSLLRPPHNHHGIWLAVGLLGPALMLAGLIFGYLAYREARREQASGSPS